MTEQSTEIKSERTLTAQDYFWCCKNSQLYHVIKALAEPTNLLRHRLMKRNKLLRKLRTEVELMKVAKMYGTRQ